MTKPLRTLEFDPARSRTSRGAGLRRSRRLSRDCPRRNTGASSSGFAFANKCDGTSNWMPTPARANSISFLTKRRVKRRRASFVNGRLQSEVHRHRRFWELFRALPSEIQNLAVKNYHLWRQNPHHPWPVSGVCREAKIATAFASEISIAPSPGEWARRSFGFGSAPTQITTGWQALQCKENAAGRNTCLVSAPGKVTVGWLGVFLQADVKGHIRTDPPRTAFSLYEKAVYLPLGIVFECAVTWK